MKPERQLMSGFRCLDWFSWPWCFFSNFPRHYAVNALGLTAFGVFVFKAAYVQSEILYYLLTFTVYLLAWRLFRRPQWGLAILTGALVGLTHLTKASVLPGLVVFLVFYPLDALWQKFQHGRKSFSRSVVISVLVPIAFLAVVFPYISKSKEVYGQYFYNVNSTFYIWCESWKDVELTVKAAGDRDGWPDLPPEEIPSLKNYLRDHSAAEIGGRIATGISRVFNTMARGPGFLWFGLAYVALAAGLAIGKWRVVWRIFSAMDCCWPGIRRSSRETALSSPSSCRCSSLSLFFWSSFPGE